MLYSWIWCHQQKWREVLRNRQSLFSFVNPWKYIYQLLSRPLQLYSICWNLSGHKLGRFWRVGIFTGILNKNLGVCDRGVALRFDTLIKVQLRSHISHLVMENFIIEWNRNTEAKLKMKSKEIWYSIINGVHIRAAVHLRTNTKTTWRDFKRYVTICKLEFQRKHYRELARQQNVRHESTMYVKFRFWICCWIFAWNMISCETTQQRWEHKKSKEHLLKMENIQNLQWPTQHILPCNIRTLF